MAKLFDSNEGVLGEDKMADFSKKIRGGVIILPRIEDGGRKLRPEMPFSRLLMCLGA